MEKEQMKSIGKIILQSIAISCMACIINIILMYIANLDIFDDWDAMGFLLIAVYGVIFVISPIMIVIINTIYMLWCFRKKNTSKMQVLSCASMSSILYIVLLLSAFQACCYYLKIGEGFGDGLFLAVSWYASLFVAGVYLFGLVCAIVHLKWQKKSTS